MPKFTISDGAKIHYCIDDFTPPWTEDKSKETIFMHHGFSRNMKWWTMMVPSLSRKYRVLRIDARGCGDESTVPSKVVTWSIERVMQDVIDLLNHLNIQKVHWVGEASGGMLGIMFAITYPERINSLSLVSTPWKLDEKDMLFRAQGYKDAPTAIMKLGFKEWTKRTFSSRFGDFSPEEQQIQSWIVGEFLKTPTRVAATFLGIYGSLDLTDRLAEVKVPLLIIRANKSQVTSGEEDKEKKYRSSVLRRVPTAMIVTLQGVGSLNIPLLRPDRCAEEIEKFVKSIER